MGVVSKQLRSHEVAISEQTGDPRIVFVEDLGLAEVVPVEFVRDTAHYTNYTPSRESEREE